MSGPRRTRLLVALLLVTVATGGAIVAGFQLTRAAKPIGAHDSKGNTGQYWNMPEAAFAIKRQVNVDNRNFYLGDAVTMPDGLRLQVLRVERNWQPTAAVSQSYGSDHDGDNPTGRETILVWFTATNVGSSSLGYSDSVFTLQRAGRPEQRVAHLASLLSSDYGSRGEVPWLWPGQSMTTFVPFLITPGEAPISFQYYSSPTQPAVSKAQAATLPTPILSRLSVQLRSPATRPATSFTFVSSQTITVGP